MKTYYVYMVQCFDGTFYVGVTNDVERRYGEHSYGIDPTCYTFSRRPLQLVYVGEFTEIYDASAFEKKLKGWTHRKKRAFAQSKWDDLKRYGRGENRPST